MAHPDLDWARSRILCITPFERPDAVLARAVARAGALAVLDLGDDLEHARTALVETASCGLPFGVRVHERSRISPRDLPLQVTTVVLAGPGKAAPWRPRSVLVQATSLAEAREAVAGGADAVIAKGAESGGRVGDEGTFVLLQRLLQELDVPVWAQGGIGLHTAAACLAGGAAGVVLEDQLALVRESSLTEPARAAIAAMDGTESAVFDGHRAYARPGAGDGQVHLTLGQSAAFAATLAQRFHTAGGVVRAVADAMCRHVEAARRLRPLSEDAPLARAHGTRYPILQGPMTRVSDRAAFAEAVAESGALPFLALALMRGPDVRALLEETATRLRHRPWGVGILGFVPEELRAEQLAVIGEHRPPFALIAGGRPAHARPLEKQGVTTYLHVPSPGLLDLYLKKGARRFVFEGRECGGHVGPRTSFTLWEQQIELLLRHDRAEELSVVFAGGIHDGVSGAMVATAAAELAAHGAKVGVLMGTAYLFTEEALASGAIQPAFHEAALACERTVLLETSPGHATRCADTPYVATFAAERRRLEGEGRDRAEIWEALERLNLGRLRLAAKGLRRDGDQLVEADLSEQLDEGMVMLGQVAALRSSALTVADLHTEVVEGSERTLADVQLPPPAVAAPDDVAIVGMACLFPKADDLASYWSNIVSGVGCISEVPASRWDPAVYFDPNNGDGRKTPSKWGGFLGEVAFDPLVFGIPPQSLAAIEPVQLLALKVARDALADAGYLDREFDRERASVIFGAESGSELSSAHSFRTLWQQYVGEVPPQLDEVLPVATEDSFPGVLANVIAGRIANRLDLGGVNFTVDAACASSLAALEIAVRELTSGTSDLVLCGAGDLHNAIGDYLMFSSSHALSAHGQCRPFDAEADGIVLGEGVAAVVLKRLGDAERDGDRIYAVVKGVGGSSDGKSLGLTAPRRLGQVRALERAYERAGVSPAEVGLIEAHGTGTVVGDRTELESLTEVFGTADAAPGMCALGSVKSQIGHTKCTAGLAGLIKVALALYHRVLPPTINLDAPNSGWQPEASPFTLSTEARPWPRRDRKAGVSAFGFGGTNFHAVVASHDDDEVPPSGLPIWPAELFLFRGETREEAAAAAERLEALLEGDEPWALRSLARSVSSGDQPVQIAFVASDLGDLRAKLARRFEADPAAGIFVATGGSEDPPKIAFLFPGQGSQRVGMLGDLFVAFPALQRFLALGERWADHIFPGEAWSAEVREAQKQALLDTRVAQPALGIAGLAAAHLLSTLGVRPDMAGGHSYGELVALTVAGAIGEDELLALSEARGECILAAAAAAGGDAGTMAAVSAAAEAVAPHLAGIDRVVIANQNAPEQMVISGPTASVEAAVERLAEAGMTARRIPVACAFHSPVVAGAAELFAERLVGAQIPAPAFPVYSNSTGRVHETGADELRHALASHVALPVRFVDEIESMYADGARVFIESGPGRILTGLVSKILGDRPHLAVALDEPGRPGLEQLLRTLAKLAANGVALDVEPLYEGRGAELFDLDSPPTRRPPASAWLVNGHTARPVSGDLPPHAMRPISQPVARLGTPAAPAGASDAVVLEYLRGMRELVEQQREVVLSYLGQDSARVTRERSGVEAPSLPAAPEIEAAEVQPEPPRPLSVEAELLALVSERTGYPTEMLDLDLDLEADLSIDSIKRIEILGALAQRLGFGEGEGSAVPEELVGAKTLRTIIESLESAFGVGTAAPARVAEPPAAQALPEGEAPPLGRYVLALETVSSPPPNGHALSGKKFAVVGDADGVGEPLLRRLQSLGAEASFLGPGERAESRDGLIDLAHLRPGPAAEAVKDVFLRARDALAGGTSTVLGVTGLGGSFGRGKNGCLPLEGGGVAGLFKSLAKEWPDRDVRVVDLDPSEEPEILAAQLAAELTAQDSLREVGYDAGVRRVLRAFPAARNGSLTLPLLGEESVVLVTGGGRGIGARVTRELARRFRCRLEIVGRSPLPPEAEDSDLSEAPDAVAIRRALLARGEREPAEIEAECARILAARELRSTLAALGEAGSQVEYHPIDVRDEAAFGRLIEDIYERHGRVDGVVHAAGLIEDRLARDKSTESFARVFETKALSAITLARTLRDDVRFICFFSSVAGVFGNRGQSDYAAANDFIDKLALSLAGRSRARVLSIAWGPWGGGGMVSPELEREYARRGIGLIDPQDGVQAFLAELTQAGDGDLHVILACADPAALA
jgi:acyl transferase domain-containing protein/NAD(P)H-dependent flavin oxidoreductase YrpB (nitropropane dioxygenase family)/NADP-dependent 3-hydroxy acid dehydrogenase YdfG